MNAHDSPEGSDGDAGAEDASVDFDAASLLITGAAMGGKDRVSLDLVATSLASGETALVVTTTDGAGQFRDRLADVAPAGCDPDVVVVVECSSTSGTLEDWDGRTHRVGSPGDLTGIGMALSKGLNWLAEGDETPGRLLVDNVTTLLVYAEFQRVFRFLNTTLQRAETVGSQVAVVFEPEVVDPSDTKQLRHLFDSVIEMRTEGKTTRVRLDDGLGAAWQDYHWADTGGDR